MMMQRDWFALVVEKRMTFGDCSLAVLVAKCCVALARYTTSREIHVWRTTRYVAAVFKCVTDADRVFHNVKGLVFDECGMNQLQKTCGIWSFCSVLGGHHWR